MNKVFEKLYKRTSTGAQQEWEISVDGNVITTRFGQTGGKIQVTTDVVREGKNVGRSNATTPEQQALLEAEATWTKKLKKGYVQDAGKAMAGEVSDVIEGGVFPMLAHKFTDQAAKIKWPAFGQPKLDGHRCIAVLDAAGKCTLWSRTRKAITGVPHIAAALEKLELRGVVLDGELYNAEYHDRFEELSSFIRQVTPKAGYEVVQYHVYDCVNDQPFCERTATVRGMLEGKSPYIVVVPTVTLPDMPAMQAAFAEYLEAGYEGLMLRNSNSPYVNKRSTDLQKVKERDDAEFKIVGVEEGRGKLAGHGIFVCETATGSRFNAKMKGETVGLKDCYEHPEKYVGKQLTVLYQGLTSDGLPRFPVGLRVAESL